MRTRINHNCKEELRQMDLRATPARIAVMQYLKLTDKPVDATTIIHYLKRKRIDADPATVFRIMQQFTQKGITNPVEFLEGKTRYELASKEDHHHLVCENCGKVQDIEDNVIPTLEKHIKKKHNFIVRHHSLEFFGLCNKCQK